MMSRVHGDAALITWIRLARALCEVTCGTPSRVNEQRSEPCAACAARTTAICAAMETEMSYRNVCRAVDDNLMGLIPDRAYAVALGHIGQAATDFVNEIKTKGRE